MLLIHDISEFRDNAPRQERGQMRKHNKTYLTMLKTAYMLHIRNWVTHEWAQQITCGHNVCQVRSDTCHLSRRITHKCYNICIWRTATSIEKLLDRVTPQRIQSGSEQQRRQWIILSQQCKYALKRRPGSKMAGCQAIRQAERARNACTT